MDFLHQRTTASIKLGIVYGNLKSLLTTSFVIESFYLSIVHFNSRGEDLPELCVMRLTRNQKTQ